MTKTLKYRKKTKNNIKRKSKTLKHKVLKNKILILVLGYKLDEGKPNIILINRVMKAVNLWKSINYPRADILMAGGESSNIKGVTEAKIMKKIAQINGVNSNYIYTENKSLTTKENVDFTKKFVEKYDTIYLVTSEGHLKRSYNLLKKRHSNKNLIKGILTN